jgi:chorismate synthase
MSVEGDADPDEKLTRPRPGHADLAGVQKYGFDDVRNVLERASARETAMRVALGVFCKAFLAELGIDVVSHVVRIGSVAVGGADVPGPEDLEAIDLSPVRCFDEEAGAKMVEEIDRIRKERDTVGGVFEVLAYGCPPGLGSHVQYDRKLDARLALALMSIQSVKGVEVGDGFALAGRRGSEAHDEILRDDAGYRRETNRAGGIEAGVSNGEEILVRAAMKPLPTLMRALRSADLETGEPAQALVERSDVSAVEALAVVAEACVALELARAAREKFGGDAMEDVRAAWRAYVERIPWSPR